MQCLHRWDTYEIQDEVPMASDFFSSPNRFRMFSITRTVFVDGNAVSDLSQRMANRKDNAVGLRGTIMSYREN